VEEKRLKTKISVPLVLTLLGHDINNKKKLKIGYRMDIGWYARMPKSAHTALAVKACLLGRKQLH
jgi:hypothetical protein